MADNNETSERTAEYTDIQEQFLNLLRKYPVKNPETVVDYVSSQGETVLEDPEILARVLAECELTPVRRRQVLKHWFAERGIEVSAALLQKVALPPDIRKRTEEAEREEKAKYSVDTESGAIRVATTTDKTALTWDEAQNLASTIKKELTEKGRARPPTYVYDAETEVVRMAKEGEVGGTLEQAKELKKMAGEGKKVEAESPFTRDAEGNWVLNPKARITGIEFMALEAIKKAQERGEAVDPLEQLVQTAEKLKIYQGAFGGGDRGMPGWMSDPAKFIEMVRTISGGGKEDEAIVREVAGLRQTIDTMKEEKFISMIFSQQEQIKASLEEVRKLGNRVEELSKPITGRTDMDIIHEIATAGIGLAQTELGGLRRDIKEVLGSSVLPTTKTPEQREGRKQVYRKSIARDEKIENLGRSLFFGENIVINPASPEEKTSEAKESYVYDPEIKRVRTAREGEVGNTLEQAKMIGEMAKTGDSLLYE